MNLLRTIGALAAGGLVLACGSVQEPPPQELREVPSGQPASTSSALYLASRDGASTVVRIEAASGTIAALTPPLPVDFEPDVLRASPAQDRFVVAGKRGSRSVVFGGTPSEWHVVFEAPEGERAYVDGVSPSLDLVAVVTATDIGAVRWSEVLTFDGQSAVYLGPERDLVRVGDGFVLVAERKGERVNGEWVAVSTEDGRLPWSVYDAAGTFQARLDVERSPWADVAAVEDGFVVRDGDGVCRTYRASDAAQPAATFRCDSLMPPLIIEGPTVYRLRAGGRDAVGTIADPPQASLLHHAGGLSAFVALREGDRVQTFTFIAADGARAAHDPGDPGNEDWNSSWTRVAGDRDRACVLASFGACAKDFQGTCTRNIVDFVCSDGRTTKTRRFHRTIGIDGAKTLGAQELTLTADGRFLLYIDNGAIHRVDTMTFETSELLSPWEPRWREGDLPSPWGRTY